MTMGAVIQARMGSSRLPRKVLEPLCGKPLLRYLLESVRRCASLDAIVVATSKEVADDPIAEFCAGEQVTCFRGSLQNVAERFVQVTGAFGFDAVVRVSGDSPLLDHRLIDRAVALFRQGGCDIVTNVCPRSFPKGQSIEVLSVQTYQRAFPRMQDPADLEHVTRFFYAHRDAYTVRNFAFEPACAELQMSVDTPQDLQRIAALIRTLERPHWEYRVEELVALYTRMIL
jgi:spore coat polysaccharide biosynthesis protein SpsF